MPHQMLVVRTYFRIVSNAYTYIVASVSILHSMPLIIRWNSIRQISAMAQVMRPWSAGSESNDIIVSHPTRYVLFDVTPAMQLHKLPEFDFQALFFDALSSKCKNENSAALPYQDHVISAASTMQK